MQIKLTSVPVDDQEKALRFYTEKLGFLKKQDISFGEARWLTVVSPEAPDTIELLLEPIGYEFARSYQHSVFAADLPMLTLATYDLQAEYERLRELGVVFRSEPQSMGGPPTVLIEDTCGNLVQLFEIG